MNAYGYQSLDSVSATLVERRGTAWGGRFRGRELGQGADRRHRATRGREQASAARARLADHERSCDAWRMQVPAPEIEQGRDVVRLSVANRQRRQVPAPLDHSQDRRVVVDSVRDMASAR